jgi:hypothetical protein
MYELLQRVVVRFDDRVRVERLQDVVITREITDKIISNYGSVSRYVEGHLRSDMTPIPPPSVAILEAEIREFVGIRQQVKSLKGTV